MDLRRSPFTLGSVNSAFEPNFAWAQLGCCLLELGEWSRGRGESLLSAMVAAALALRLRLPFLLGAAAARVV